MRRERVKYKVYQLTVQRNNYHDTLNSIPVILRNSCEVFIILYFILLFIFRERVREGEREEEKQ